MFTKFLEAVEGALAPRAALRRAVARRTLAQMTGGFDAASLSPQRSSGWPRRSPDPTPPAMASAVIRARARYCADNVPMVQRAVQQKPAEIAGGRGVRCTVDDPEWERWVDTVACDSAGQSTFAGLQRQLLRETMVVGEVLCRVRVRPVEDDLPLPLQLEAIPVDVLDVSRDRPADDRRNRIYQGIEFDRRLRRVAYYMRVESRGRPVTVRVPAREIHHMFRPHRIGAVRGVSWIASALNRARDCDVFADATLMAAKTAACLSAFRTDYTGEVGRSGIRPEVDPDDNLDQLIPGGIHNLAPGEDIKVVTPTVSPDYAGYGMALSREVAAGAGVQVEAVAQHYSGRSYSSSRFSNQAYLPLLDSDFDDVLIPFLHWVYAWARRVHRRALPEVVEWIRPGRVPVDPVKETAADLAEVRAGFSTMSAEIRKRGRSPERVFAELEADRRRVENLPLDSDPSQTSQQGQAQSLFQGALDPDDDPDDDRRGGSQ